MIIIVGWIWVIVSILVVTIFAYSLIHYLSDIEDRKWYLTLASSCSLSVSLCSLLLIPIDIYNVSVNNNHQVNENGDAIMIMYQICYLVIIIMAFIVLPFVYFYFEEQDDYSVGDENKCSHVMAALRYTFVFILLFGVLLTIGFVIRNDNFADKHKNDNNQEWYKTLQSEFGVFDAVISFMVACLASFGLIFWLTYGGFGLIVLPKLIIKAGMKSGGQVTPLLQQQQQSTIEETAEMKSLRNDMEFLKAKYADDSYNAWTTKDRLKLRELERKERNLLREQLPSKHRSNNDKKYKCCICNNCWSKCCMLLAPIRAVLGIILILISLLIISSLLITSIDKLLHSNCKEKCGYLLDGPPQLFNPLDRLLQSLVVAFPIDWFFFSSLIIYLFLCIVSGLMHYGVRVFCIELYEIKPQSSMPHGLVMGVWVIIFAVLSLNMQLMTLLPGYVTYGDQMITIDGEKHHCSTIYTHMNSTQTSSSSCVMTQVGRFINTTQISEPFFGVIFFWSGFAFCGFALLAILRQFVCVKNNNYEQIDNEKDFDRGFESYRS